MPFVQDNRFVIGVRDSTSSVHACVAFHDLKVLLSGLRVVTKQRLVFARGQTHRVLVRNVNDVATAAKCELEFVRFAAPTSTDRFVAQDQVVLHDQVWFGHKEPFALSSESVVAPRALIIRVQTNTVLHGFDRDGLEGFHGGGHVADAVTRHGAGEPMAFVVTAQEFVFASLLANHQEQVTQVGFDIKHVDVRRAVFGNGDFKVRAAFVFEHVQAEVDDGLGAPTVLEFVKDFGSSANVLEFVLNECETQVVLL